MAVWFLCCYNYFKITILFFQAYVFISREHAATSKEGQRESPKQARAAIMELDVGLKLTSPEIRT